MSARPVSHVDPRSPFVVDTRELGRRAGSMVEVRREVTAPGDWGLDLVGVPEGAEVGLDLRLESVVDGVLVSATIHAPLAGECGRCLEPFDSELDLPTADLFLYEPDPDDDEVPVVDGDFIDLEAMLRDAIVLALPLNPVCDEGCEGLCVGCGARLVDVEPGHTHENLDPRWASLAALNEQSGVSSATMDEDQTTDPADSPASPMREK